MNGQIQANVDGRLKRNKIDHHPFMHFVAIIQMHDNNVIFIICITMIYNTYHHHQSVAIWLKMFAQVEAGQERTSIQVRPPLLRPLQWLALPRGPTWIRWAPNVDELYLSFPAHLGAARGRCADGRPPASPYLPLPPYSCEGVATHFVAQDFGALAQTSTSHWRITGDHVASSVSQTRTLYIEYPLAEVLFLFEGIERRMFLADLQ